MAADLFILGSHDKSPLGRWNDRLLRFRFLFTFKEIPHIPQVNHLPFGFRDYRNLGCSTSMRISPGQNGDMDERCHLKKVSTPEFKPFLIACLSVCVCVPPSSIVGLVVSMFRQKKSRNISPFHLDSASKSTAKQWTQWTYKAYHTQKDIIHDVHLAFLW